jgi:Big-like domain-containing protein
MSKPAHSSISRFALVASIFVLAVLLPGRQESRAQPDRNPTSLSVHWIPDSADTNKFVVEVSGLSTAMVASLRQSNWKPPQWQRLLSVYAGQGDVLTDIGLPPMQGTYRVSSDALRFEPQFPLEPNVKYRAVLQPDQLPGERRSKGKFLTAHYEVPPRTPNPSTLVSHVYPSADVLPENLLKFYVHFSAPMSGGHIYQHIHLRNDTGKDVELPFLEIDEELWDPAMKRLTLFIDPGRIKRGVHPLEEVGPALEEGKSYLLIFDSAWKDGTGNPLKASFRKAFKVGPPDRQPLDPAQWKIQSPKSATSQPLAVTFSKPMDHALAQRMIRVTDESERAVEGTIALEDQERRWVFRPATPWRRGPYKLIVQTTIEDLAGNNIGKPFEVDLFEGVQRRLTPSTVKLPFQVQ